MKQLDLGRSTLTFEHKGEIFKLYGELYPHTFVACKDWSDKLTSKGEKIELTEKEKLRVMDIVKKYWRSKDFDIQFEDSDYHPIFTTKKLR